MKHVSNAVYPSPGVHLVPGNASSARQLARDCNEVGADMKKKKPDKFGYYTWFPLSDVEGSLMKLPFAKDELNADGVALLTYTHGICLGNPALKLLFDPFFVLAEFFERLEASQFFLKPNSNPVLI